MEEGLGNLTAEKPGDSKNKKGNDYLEKQRSFYEMVDVFCFLSGFKFSDVAGNKIFCTEV